MTFMHMEMLKVIMINARREKKGKKNRKESNNTSYSAVSMNKITICLVNCLLTKETYLSCRALSAK